jgi:hypothetical protein
MSVLKELERARAELRVLTRPTAADCLGHEVALHLVGEHDPAPSVPPCRLCGATADAVVVRLRVVTVRPEPGDTGLVGVVEEEARNGHE